MNAVLAAVIFLVAWFASGLLYPHPTAGTVYRVPPACTRAATEAAAVIAAAHHREPYIERVLNAAWHHHAIRLMIPADDPRTPDLSSCK